MWLPSRSPLVTPCYLSSDKKFIETGERSPLVRLSLISEPGIVKSVISRHQQSPETGIRRSR